MKRIEFNNFRVFREKIHFDLAPLTILTGRNNSGKSSVLKGCMILSDLLQAEDQLSLSFDGKFGNKHKIVQFGNAVNWFSNSKKIEMGFQDGNYQYLYELTAQSDDKKILLTKFETRNLLNGENIQLRRQSNEILHMVSSERFLDLFTGGNESSNNNSKKLIEERDKIKGRINELESSLLLPFEESRQISQKRIDEKQKLELRYKLLNNWIRKFKDNPEQLNLIVEIDIDLKKEFQNGGKILDIIRYGILQVINKPRFSVIKKQLIKNNQLSLTLGAISIHSNNEIFHLGADRFYQARLYMKGDQLREINKIVNNFANYQPKKGTKEHRFLTKWLQTFEIGSDLDIEVFEGEAASIFVYPLDGKKSKLRINLCDKGFGSGQIISLLLKITNTYYLRVEKKGEEFKSVGIDYPGEFIPSSILLIEEPETNLHPRFQSLLAEMFYEASRELEIQFIIETHSEYLIRKLQLLVSKEIASSEDFVIHYLEDAIEKSASKINVKKITIGENGTLSDSFGEGFVDEADEMAMELYRIHRKKEFNK